MMDFRRKVGFWIVLSAVNAGFTIYGLIPDNATTAIAVSGGVAVLCALSSIAFAIEIAITKLKE